MARPCERHRAVVVLGPDDRRLQHVLQARFLSRPEQRREGRIDRHGPRPAPSPASRPRCAPTTSPTPRRRRAEVLTRTDANASQPWENPNTGARGTVTPTASAYTQDGFTCRDFLASYVRDGRSPGCRATPAASTRANGPSATCGRCEAKLNSPGAARGPTRCRFGHSPRSTKHPGPTAGRSSHSRVRDRELSWPHPHDSRQGWTIRDFLRTNARPL